MPLSRRSNGEHVNPPRTAADQDRGDEPTTYTRQHLLVVGATILIVLAVAAVVIRPTWHPWEKQTPPTSLCDGVYATSEINRLAHMQTVGYWGSGRDLCGIRTEKGAEDDSDRRIFVIRIWLSKRFNAGYGIEWDRDALASDSSGDVKRFDVPDLEGEFYTWHYRAENTAYGFWVTDRFFLVVSFYNPDQQPDGPATTEQALELMPDLLSYIAHQADQHGVLPSTTPTTEPPPIDPTTQPATEPTS